MEKGIFEERGSSLAAPHHATEVTVHSISLLSKSGFVWQEKCEAEIVLTLILSYHCTVIFAILIHESFFPP